MSLTDQHIRHDWELDEILGLFELPLNDLLFRAQSVHRRYHPANEVQISTLLSIKTGGCPEDCKYCPQSVHYDTGLDAHNLLAVDDVVDAARKARDAGATRFCMGAAWRSPTNSQTRRVGELIEAVKDLGMETCATLGMLTPSQAQTLAQAGLDYYNPQSRHVAGLLRPDHHLAELRGPAGHVGECSGRGHQRLLRRHRRDGRDPGRPGRVAGAARESA